MKQAVVHGIILLVVAVITLTVLFIIYRPDLLEDIWLWLVGLAGTIIGLVREAIKSLFKFIKSIDRENQPDT